MNNLTYLDYCATTPVNAVVIEAMVDSLAINFGNPSSMHQAGMDAKALIDQARANVAEAIMCSPEEIIFTSGATEADNLALFGVIRQYSPGDAHLVTSSIEHHAVLHAAHRLEDEGYDVTILPVDGDGIVNPDLVEQAIKPHTKLVSIMSVNNEVGSQQYIEAIGKITASNNILFHTDAVQSIGLMDIDVTDMNIDLLSLSAHKIYGPKGVGALFLRNGIKLNPVIYGGPQESRVRPGTENVPGIVGLGTAVRLVQENKVQERERLSHLRSWFIEVLREKIPGIVINGSELVSPHILSVGFPNAVAEMMQLHLHMHGIAVSLGSACTSKIIEPSHVLLAMGLPLEQIEGTIRFSFGYPTTAGELEPVLDLLPDVWERSLNQ